MAMTLKKEYSDICTPPLGLHSLFKGTLCCSFRDQTCRDLY